jgi:hypothetical protein
MVGSVSRRSTGILSACALIVGVVSGCGRFGFDPADGSPTLKDADVLDANPSDAIEDTHLNDAHLKDAHAADDSDAHPSAGPVFSNASSGAAEAASVTFAHKIAPGADRLLLVGSHIASKAYTTGSVTYAGKALTQIDTEVEAATPGEDCNSTLWYLVNPPVGTANVVSYLEEITTDRPMAVWAMSFTGVNQTTPLGKRSSAFGITLATSASVSVASAVGELVVDNYCMAITPPGSLAAGASQTERIRQDAPSNDLRAAASTEPGSASVTVSWSFDPAYYTLHAVALRPADGGP